MIYLQLEGLNNLIPELRGDERIHIGIRPYGFHSGNATALVGYPFILCQKYFEYTGKEPSFTFIYSINDWEQDALDGPDYVKYPFNIYPKFTNINNITHEEGSNVSMVDYWHPKIEKITRHILSTFSDIKIEFYRNSELRDNESYKRIIIQTIQDPLPQFEIYKNFSNRLTLDSPINYGGIICKKCKSSHGKSKINGENFEFICDDCKTVSKGGYGDFEFWVYHKPLLAARLTVYKVDILLSGGDHFSEGDAKIREKIFELFCPEIKVPHMIFTPTLLSYQDGTRMSKSRKNAEYANLYYLIELLFESYEKEFKLTSDLLLNKPIEEYVEYICSIKPVWLRSYRNIISNTARAQEEFST